MIKQLFTLFVLAILAMITPGTVQLDGVARGTALGGVALNLGHRKLALAFVEYRPGRVYYRAVCATC